MTPQSPSALPRLGRYELIAGIASGGMGSVVLARLAGAGGFQRLVAIKILHRHFLNDEEFVSMLLDEARIAARIHHPNVVSIQEIVESEEHGYYLVMDYVEGYPLSDILPFLTSVPWAMRWRIVNRVILDALHGLHAAHSLIDDHGNALHVVHRDMSPQNILLSVEGIARVTDFGIAKAEARFAHTKTGSVKGKLAYMAPEQARGRPVDARADLFSVGVVLWESLAGQRLFKAANELETFTRIVSGRIPWLREIVPGMPEALDVFVMRALERELDRRFVSAREMAAALERAARANDLVADAIEVGEWMQQTFADKLEERRAAVRRAAKDTLISGSVPLLPNARGGDNKATVSIKTGAGNDDVITSQDGAPEEEEGWDRAPTTHMDTSNAPDELKAAIAAFQASLGAPPVPTPASGGPIPHSGTGAQQAPPRRPATLSESEPGRSTGMRASIPGVAIATAPSARISMPGAPPAQPAPRASMPGGTPATGSNRAATSRSSPQGSGPYVAAAPPARASQSHMQAVAPPAAPRTGPTPSQPGIPAPPSGQLFAPPMPSATNQRPAGPPQQPPMHAAPMHQPPHPQSAPAQQQAPVPYGFDGALDDLPTNAIMTGDPSSPALPLPPATMSRTATTPYVYPPAAPAQQPAAPKRGGGRTALIVFLVLAIAAVAIVAGAYVARLRGVHVRRSAQANGAVAFTPRARVGASARTPRASSA